MPKGDGGHWPKGRRRHAGVRVRGWRSLPAMLAAASHHCAEHRGSGALMGLARRLRVHHSTAAAWIAGEKWPSQRRADQIAAWLRSR